MYNVVFGDSIAAGENNGGVSFVEYLGGTNFNAGVSGTTIGEYSIYPVDGNSLLSLIGKNANLLKNCENVLIEYGCNDVASIMCGFATEQTVIVSLVKALDWIKQINPNCHVYFLALGSDGVITEFAKNECNYLQYDYFGKFGFRFPVNKFAEIYKNLLNHIGKICDILYMFYDTVELSSCISSDGIHPNDLGHTTIAEKLNQCI